MLNQLRIGLVGVYLLFTLLACTDHRLVDPQSPVRLRLKAIKERYDDTTYMYNSQNRLITISPTNGSQTALTYDAQNRLADLKQYSNSANLAFGSATLLSYSADGVSFQAKTYNIINSVIEVGVVQNTADYSFDANKHITSVTNQTREGQYSGEFYTYTGENITGVEVVAYYNKTIFINEYDDKINPFFGITDLNVSNSVRFSRNNLTKISYIAPNGKVIPFVSYQYEYNQQGLPTKRTTIQGGTGVISYTYESY